MSNIKIKSTNNNSIQNTVNADTSEWLGRSVEFGKILNQKGITLTNPQEFSASIVLRTVEAYLSSSNENSIESQTIMENMLNHVKCNDQEDSKIDQLSNAHKLLVAMEHKMSGSDYCVLTIVFAIILMILDGMITSLSVQHRY